MQDLTKIFFHYHINENQHSMNAIVRNKCEYQIIEMLNELFYSYGIFFEIDIEAKAEGGIIDYINVRSINHQSVQTICAVLTVFLTGATLINTLLPDEEKSLRIELLKLQIKKEKDLDSEKTITATELKNTQEVNDQYEISAYEVIQQIEKNKSMLLRRSSFYEQLSSDPRVYKFSSGIYKNNFEHEVPSSSFPNLIVRRPEKKEDKVELASIALISPVFKRRKYKWKGIYDNNVISFKVSDKNFNKLVRANGFAFNNDDLLECSLEIKGEVDFVGDWINKEITVTKVHYVVKDGVKFQVSTGLAEQNQGSNKLKQGSLFS